MMNERNYVSRLGLAALCLGLTFGQAFADDKANDQKKQQMQRKLEQEKNKLSKEKAELEGKVKEVEGKVADAEANAKAAAGRSARLKKEIDAVKATLAETEKSLAETKATLAKTETEKTAISNDLARHKREISVCEDKNSKLHSIGNDLLKRYEGKGCFEALIQAEPLTGLKQVQIENYVEGQRDKLDQQRIEHPATR